MFQTLSEKVLNPINHTPWPLPKVLGSIGSNILILIILSAIFYPPVYLHYLHQSSSPPESAARSLPHLRSGQEELPPLRRAAAVGGRSQAADAAGHGLGSAELLHPGAGLEGASWAGKLWGFEMLSNIYVYIKNIYISYFLKSYMDRV